MEFTGARDKPPSWGEMVYERSVAIVFNRNSRFTDYITPSTVAAEQIVGQDCYLQPLLTSFLKHLVGQHGKWKAGQNCYLA